MFIIDTLFMIKYTVLYMQYCCNSTVATAGVLNVRAKRLLPQRAPPCPPLRLEKLFLTSRAPPTCPPKVWQNCFSPAVPPPNLEKTVFHRSSGWWLWWWLVVGGVTCDQQIPRFARTKVIQSWNYIFFNEIIWFLARIDQQVKSYHSSSWKQYSNIKSRSIIKLHFS